MENRTFLRNWLYCDIKRPDLIQEPVVYVIENIIYQSVLENFSSSVSLLNDIVEDRVKTDKCVLSTVIVFDAVFNDIIDERYGGSEMIS